MPTLAPNPKKKPGPHARKKAREAAAAAPLQEKPPTPGKVPRVKPYVERASSEELTVPLSPDDWTQKSRIMLGVRREKTQLEADRKAENDRFKTQIKDKESEIVELETQLLSGTKKRVVPLLVRYYLKDRRKVILNAATKKKVRDEPMTPTEVREVSASQPELLAGDHGTPPAAPSPAPEATPTAQQAELPAGGENDDEEAED